MPAGERRQGAAHRDQVPLEHLETFPDLEREAGVDDVLGRGAEVDVLRRFAAGSPPS